MWSSRELNGLKNKLPNRASNHQLSTKNTVVNCESLLQLDQDCSMRVRCLLCWIEFGSPPKSDDTTPNHDRSESESKEISEARDTTKVEAREETPGVTVYVNRARKVSQSVMLEASRALCSARNELQAFDLRMREARGSFPCLTSRSRWGGSMGGKFPAKKKMLGLCARSDKFLN